MLEARKVLGRGILVIASFSAYSARSGAANDSAK
jgi:hypothetical protein